MMTMSSLQATGVRLGTLTEASVGLLSSIIIAFVYAWLLTIVLLLLVPIIALSGFLKLKALTSHASSNKEALEQSSKVLYSLWIVLMLYSKITLAH